MRATLLLPIFTLALGALANPPACLLAAVNTQDDPSDLAGICGKNATDVQSAIDSECKNENKSAAQEAFISTCSVAGSTVAAYTPTATSDSSATESGSSASNTASGFGSATGSGAGASATGNTGAADVRVMGTFVVGAIAVAGLAVGL